MLFGRDAFSEETRYFEKMKTELKSTYYFMHSQLPVHRDGYAYLKSRQLSQIKKTSWQQDHWTYYRSLSFIP